VVVNDLHIKSISVPPQKTDTVLIIDPNAVLSPAISAQPLQLVPWWNFQVVERDGGIQNRQFLKRPPLKIGRQATTLARSP
jgi:hypothetical protein